MLDAFFGLFECVFDLAGAIRRYRSGLGMYVGDYSGGRGWREKFLKNKI